MPFSWPIRSDLLAQVFPPLASATFIVSIRDVIGLYHFPLQFWLAYHLISRVVTSVLRHPPKNRSKGHIPQINVFKWLSSQQVTQQLISFLTDQNLVGVHLAKERLGIPSFKFGSFIFMAASNSPVKNLPPYRSRYGCTWQFSRSCKIVFFLTLWGLVKNIKIQMYIPDNASQTGNTEEGTKQRKMIKQRRLVKLF